MKISFFWLHKNSLLKLNPIHFVGYAVKPYNRSELRNKSWTSDGDKQSTYRYVIIASRVCLLIKMKSVIWMPPLFRRMPLHQGRAYLLCGWSATLLYNHMCSTNALRPRVTPRATPSPGARVIGTAATWRALPTEGCVSSSARVSC